MLWLLSCILTQSSQISSDCFLSECDSAHPVSSIDVFFEPAQAHIDSTLTCRSAQIFPFATPEFHWSHNDQALTEAEDSLFLEATVFQSNDRIGCHIEWYEDSFLYAEGSAEIHIH